MLLWLQLASVIGILAIGLAHWRFAVHSIRRMDALQAQIRLLRYYV